MLYRAGNVSGLALLGVLIVHLLGSGGNPAASATPLLVGLLVGLPHGAVDHLLPAWRSARARRLPRRLGLLLGYATAAGAGLLAFGAAPVPVVLGFLVLTIAHFGTGDEAFHAERDARPLRLRPHGVLAHGGPPVIFPLALWRDHVDPLLEQVAAGASVLLTAEVRAAALVGTTLAIAITTIDRLRTGDGADVVRLGLLAAVFAVVPPPLAFGVYFAAWHSLRHVARLLNADPANAAALRAGRLGRPLGRFVVLAAGPTVVVLLGFGLLAATTRVLPAAFAVLAALTVPHAAVVAWLDRPRTPIAGLASPRPQRRSATPGCNA